MSKKGIVCPVGKIGLPTKRVDSRNSDYPWSIQVTAPDEQIIVSYSQ